MSFGRSARYGLGLGAILLGGALVGVGIREFGTDDRSRPAAPRNADGSESAHAPTDLRVVPQPTVPVRTWNPGARYAYRYKSVRAFGMKARAQARGARFELQLEGTLALTVVDANAELIQLHAELRDARLSSQGARPPEGVDDSTLRRPFFVTVERAGRVTELHFDKSLDGETRNQLKSVIASMQFVAPSQPELSDWESVEQDPAGEYIASYSCGGMLPTVKKSKLRYTRVHSASGLVPVTSVGNYEVTSRGAVTLETDGWPRIVDDEEMVVVTLPGQGSDYGMEARISATLVGMDEAPSLIGALDRESKNLDKSTFDLSDQFAAADAHMDANRVGKSDFRKMLAELSSLSQSRGDLAKAHAMVPRLGALFRLTPKATEEARDALLKQPAGMTSRALIGGLSAAGTPGAQDALADVSRAKDVPAETREAATIGLGLSTRPTTDAIKATKEAMDSSDPIQHSSGALALGNQIREGHADEPEATSDALATLLERLEGATTVDETVLYLDALGNTGDERALPTIQKYLSSEHPAIRAAAEGALRFMDAPHVDALLIAGLAIDPEPRVRLAALTAMSFRKLQPFAAAIITALRSDPSKAVRSQALSLLVRHADAIEGAREAIAWVASNDQDPGLRAAAERAIASN